MVDYIVTKNGNVRVYLGGTSMSQEDVINFFDGEAWTDKVQPSRGVVHGTLGKSITIKPKGKPKASKVEKDFLSSLAKLQPSVQPDVSTLETSTDATPTNDAIDAIVASLQEAVSVSAAKILSFLSEVKNMLRATK